ASRRADVRRAGRLAPLPLAGRGWGWGGGIEMASGRVRQQRPPPRCFAPTLPARAGLSHVTQHIEEEGFVPSCSLEFATQRSLGVGVGADDVEGETPENGQVGWRVVLAISRQILVEHDVEHPMQAVFDGPM